MNGYIKMTLLSDTCVGTGFSVSGIVDTEISFDEHGIPFIPSKRILGIMRELARELCAMSGQDDDRIDKLFGKAGQDKSGLVTLRNGTIDNIQHFTNRLVWEKKPNAPLVNILSPENIMNCFTTVRTQTAMQNGVADENTLRASRVINKGVVYYFPISAEDCCKEDKEFVKDIIACIRHIGTNRNRGFGYVQCELIDSPQTEVPEKALPTDATGFLFSVQLISDCILGKGFVPASTMLGICVSKYIKKHRLTKEMAHSDEGFCNLFLTGQVKISDAYPSSTGRKTIPTPRCFKLKKDKEDIIFNLFANQENAQYKAPDFSYCEISNGHVSTEKLKTATNFHHKRNDDPSIGNANGDGQFYEYESIPAGTVFVGDIKSNVENIKILWGLLDDETVFIGKSHKTQYGNCKITLSIAKDDNSLDDFDDSVDQIPIMLVSDLVVLNQYGQPSLSLEDVKAVMIQQLDEPSLDFCHNKCYLAISTFGGFNTKHKLPTPVFSCIEKGSVITINIKEVSDKAAFIQKLYHTPIGEYTKNGCGRMILLPKCGTELFYTKTPEKVDMNSKENKSPLFDAMLPKLKENYYKMVFKESLYSKYLQNKYFSDVYAFLKDTKYKSHLRFLYDLCSKTQSIQDIIQAFAHPIEKEQKDRREKKPYQELYQKLNFPKLNNNEFSNTSIIQDIWSGEDLANAKNALYSLFKEIPIDKLDEYFCFALSILCKKAMLERRQKDVQDAKSRGV